MRVESFSWCGQNNGNQNYGDLTSRDAEAVIFHGIYCSAHKFWFGIISILILSRRYGDTEKWENIIIYLHQYYLRWMKFTKTKFENKQRKYYFTYKLLMLI